MPKAHIIILDMHGEYCWKREDGSRYYAFPDSIVRHIDARDLEIPYWLMTYAELCDLLIDRTEQAAHNQTAFFRDTLRLLREKEKTPLGLKRVTVDTPVYFSLDELVAAIETKNGEMVKGSRGPKQGDMFGVFDRFLVRLESRMNDVRYNFLLKPKIRTSSTSLSALLRDFVGIGTPKVPVTVIDLSSVPFDVRPTVAAQIGRLAFEFNYWNQSTGSSPSCSCVRRHTPISRATAMSSSRALGSQWSGSQRKAANTEWE